MTGHIYRNVILEQLVRLFRGAMGAEFLFMDDNARPHRANNVDECLQSEDITRRDWPAYSLNLNPIRHVWVMLGRRIVASQPPPTCLPELRRPLLDEWCNIPQDQIDNLIPSMHRHFPFTCGQEFSSDVSKNGTFTSPNYPEPYPEDVNCVYSFMGRGKERVQIQFTDFDLHLPHEPPRE
ncbi:transposable element Tcb2 transposase [Trichonephila clavipes]|nr:transposable element Tcb2 transposase [Trichonephila clavipes]